MAFNPDEYIAQKQGFNPDTYLAEKSGQATTSIDKRIQAEEALKQTMGEESWLGRQAAGLGAAPIKLYYGAKQLLQGGTLSPEDQQAVRDWTTIEQNALPGAIAGNLGTMYLASRAIPGGGAIMAPQTAAQAGLVGSIFGLAQPTGKQGAEGFVERGKEGLKSGVMGLAGYGAAKAIGKVLNPAVDPEIALLQKEGITPTIGQTIGGRAQVTESKLTSVPIMGDLIASNQGKGIDALNVAAYNRALSPIGEKSSGQVGFKGVEEVHKKLSEKYADLTGKMSFKPDNQFSLEMGKIRGMIDELPEQYAGMYDKMLNRIVASRATPQGNMSGETLKSVESGLTKQISKLRSGTPSYEHSQIADALEAAQTAIRDNLARQSPDWAKELAQVNKGWANYAIIRDAASTATGRKGGAFTPANLASAVTANAKRMSGQAAGKGNIASGQALMQDLASAAENRLAAAYPDSGTAGRILPYALTAAGGGVVPGAAIPTAIGIGAGSIPYLPGVNKLSNLVLTQRPELLRQMGEKATELAPYSALAGLALSQ